MILKRYDYTILGMSVIARELRGNMSVLGSDVEVIGKTGCITKSVILNIMLVLRVITILV